MTSAAAGGVTACGCARSRYRAHHRRRRQETACDVVFIARRDGKTDDVDQQVLAFAPHRLRQLSDIQRADLLHQMLGDGGFGERFGHVYISLAVNLAPGMSPEFAIPSSAYSLRRKCPGGSRLAPARPG